MANVEIGFNIRQKGWFQGSFLQLRRVREPNPAPVSLRTENRELRTKKREQPASFAACGLSGGLVGID
jgi:hypothetical protein